MKGFNHINQIPGFEKVHFHASNGPRETLRDIQEVAKARNNVKTRRFRRYFNRVGIILVILILLAIFAQILNAIL